MLPVWRCGGAALCGMASWTLPSVSWTDPTSHGRLSHAHPAMPLAVPLPSKRCLAIRLAESPTAAGGRDPDPGPAYRGRGPARHGSRGHHDYARYHEVLNRAVWSSRQVARILLLLLLQYLDRGDGPLVFGIGSQDLDAVRSVATNWSRPVACAGLGPIGPCRCSQCWRSERYCQRQGHRHVTDWARQMNATAPLAAPAPTGVGGRQRLRRAGPAHCCQSLREPVTLIARLRVDGPVRASATPSAGVRMVGHR